MILQNRVSPQKKFLLDLMDIYGVRHNFLEYSEMTKVTGLF
jgi:hypothetical protein